jgi:hypothetical protein
MGFARKRLGRQAKLILARNVCWVTNARQVVTNERAQRFAAQFSRVRRS